MNNNFVFKSGILGGTFDNFHFGHKFIIDKAFEKSEFVIVGMTTDEFVRGKKLSLSIQSFNVRKKNLETYLKKKSYLKRSKIIPISDIYGNTLTEKDIDVIFATSDTLENAELINLKRLEIGFKPLEIFLIELQKGNDKKIISSTRIRIGEIDEQGRSFLKLFENKEKLVLPFRFRDDFKKPIGELVLGSKKLKTKTKNLFVITVGDIVTSTLVSLGKAPNLSIFDFKTKREEIHDETILSFLPLPDITLSNEPGTISSITAGVIHNLILKNLDDKRPYSIKIIGEEDLLTIPAILLAPIHSIVLYGLRDVGAVVVHVTLQKKKNLLNQYFSKLKSPTN